MQKTLSNRVIPIGLSKESKEALKRVEEAAYRLGYRMRMRELRKEEAARQTNSPEKKRG